MSNKIMTRNKTGLRLALDDISLTAGQSVALRTARASRHFSDLKGTECGVANGSCLTTLRLVVTLLLMMARKAFGNPSVILRYIFGMSSVELESSKQDDSKTIARQKQDGRKTVLRPVQEPGSCSAMRVLRYAAVLLLMMFLGVNTAWGQTEVTSPTIELTAESYTYNGAAQNPVASVKDGETVIPSEEYTISYKKGDDVVTECKNVGTYTIVITDNPGGSYTVSGTKDFTIAAASLTIKADDKEKNYGEADPPLTYTVTSLMGEDTKDDVFQGTLERASGSDAKQYDINQGTLALKEGVVNYDISGFTKGTFTIHGTAINPTVTLADWTYGTPNNPSVSGNTGKGKVTYYYKGQNQGNDKYSTTKPVNAGNYTIKAEIAAKNQYEAGTATANFKINKAPLTITADAKEKYYLDEDPVFTFSVEGLKYSDTKENVVTKCDLQRTAGEDVVDGGYEITKNGDPTTSSNYTSTFVPSILTIHPKNLGTGGNPSPGITIYAQKQGESPWSVSLYNGSRAFLDSDFDSEVSPTDIEGNYSVTVTAKSDNCTGSATTEYSTFNFPITIGTTEKAAPYFTAEQDLKTSEDIRPYIVNKVNPSVGTISIAPISFIPKDIPVLLLASSDASGLTLSPMNDNKSISNVTLSYNKLMYSSEGPVTVAAAQAYLYYNGEFVLTTAGSIKQDRFYLYNPNYNGNTEEPEPTPAPSRTLRVIKDDTTGLFMLREEVPTDTSTDRWYTLDGRRLNGKPTKKGLYIKNNNKVVVK